MHRQNDWKNIKWALGVLALGGVLFGCAGNSVGGGGTGTTSTSATTGGLFSDVAGVNLPDTPASLQYVFLTGAGRAGDTKVINVRKLYATDIFGTTDSGTAQKTLHLTDYASQILQTNTDLLGKQSRSFLTIQLNVLNYTQTDSSGSASFNQITNIPGDITSAATVFKGRQTMVPMFLDPDTFITQTDVNNVISAKFDSVWFDTINRITGDSVTIRGFLSDYICFDVSNLNPGDLPSLSNANGTANRIFFSGDGFALGAGDPSNGGSTGAPFELILQAGQGASVVGRYSAPSSLAGTLTPGTYTTLAVDPSDVTTTDPVLAHKITSFQGTWKNHYNQKVNPLTGSIEDLGYLKNAHPFEAISIPTSLDDERQQVVMFSETISTNGNGTKSATITGMMWGYLDIATKKVFVYPLTNLTDPSAITNRTGEVVGNLGTLFTASGASTLSPQQMRYASFTFATPPAGFPATGTIVVVRR